MFIQKRWKKLCLLASCFSLLIGCSGGNQEKAETKEREIHIVSREEGSGTRGAFVELFKVEAKDENGKKVDYTSDDAIITNSTAVMLSTVSGDEDAIGYVSLGALNDSVQTVRIDGVEATVAEIKNGNYKISRPFNIVTKGELTLETQDFISFVLSKEGQSVVEKAGYIGIDTTENYQASASSGKVTVSGSSSVSPVMEKLKEAYQQANPGIEVEIQQSDSSTGITNVIDGVSNIGMASRNIKDSEKEKGIVSQVIAIDGIAVIINNNNSVNHLRAEQVRDIFTGAITTWPTEAN